MKRLAIIITAALLILSSAHRAQATRIQDLVRLKGAEQNKLVGMGLVVGLKGTGDGGKYLPAMRPLAKAMNKLIDENVIAAELRDVKNVAMVMVEATVPAAGAREGDLIDVHVSSIGSAKSLAGGRLMPVALIHEGQPGTVFAYASGSIEIQDVNAPTTGLGRQGARLTANIWTQFYDSQYRITLVVDSKIAGFPVSDALARHINDEISPNGPDLAKAIDGKNIVIAVPFTDRDNPSMFIKRILTSHIDPAMINTPAMVSINRKTKTIVITGDVRLSPVIVSHPGLMITTITPPPQPSGNNPQVDQDGFVLLNPTGQPAEAELTQLVDALKLLKVDDVDRIAIIEEIHRTGKLHAKLMIDE